MFGGWAGRWHQNLEIYGPSGRTPEYGTAKMVEGMKMMLGWHIDAFSVFPVGKAWDFKVHEFDFRDNGGVIYDQHGARVIHWQRSHAKDGASGYRLDWNGLCFVWTGDGRPSHLDTHHTPGYAAGYLANRIKPRILMTTHMPFDLSGGKLVVPHPPKAREDIQEPFVRRQEIDPRDYYPRRYHPEPLQNWPVEGDLVIPTEALPENLQRSMGEAARVKADNLEALRSAKP